MKATTKVFQSGRSQAVRIPKCFRFQTNTVNIRKQGESIILTPQSDLSWDDFFGGFGIMNDNFTGENLYPIIGRSGKSTN